MVYMFYQRGFFFFSILANYYYHSPGFIQSVSPSSYSSWPRLGTDMCGVPPSITNSLTTYSLVRERRDNDGMFSTMLRPTVPVFPISRYILYQ